MQWVYHFALVILTSFLIIYYTIHYEYSFKFDKYQLKSTEMNSKTLNSILHEPIFTYWNHKHKNFNNCDTLKLDDQSIKLGLEHSGSSTNKAIQRLTTKALNGKNITMLSYGGSSSCGADLGPHNKNLTFHHIVQTWWNNAIAPITGSYMERNVISVGGVGSKYFGICWKEYLPPNTEIDLIVLEFFLNDPYSNIYGKVIEKFIRSILLYHSQPGLIFAKFSSKSRFVKKSKLTISNKKDQILSQLAKSYQFTSLNLYRSVFYKLKHSRNIQIDDLYAGIYHSHPSKLAHAQMAYLIITYLKNQILGEVKFRTESQIWSSLKNTSNIVIIINPQKQTILPTLPQAVFNTIDINSTCWSAILPDDRFIMPHSLFSLHVEYMKGFVKYKQHDWDVNKAVRSDVRGGYLAQSGNASIRIVFPISLTSKGHVYASVSGVDNGGMTVIKVSSNQGYRRTLTINCSRKVYTSQHVYYIGKFPTGKNTLVIKTIYGCCLFHAVMVE